MWLNLVYLEPGSPGFSAAGGNRPAVYGGLHEDGAKLHLREIEVYGPFPEE